MLLYHIISHIAIALIVSSSEQLSAEALSPFIVTKSTAGKRSVGLELHFTANSLFLVIKSII